MTATIVIRKAPVITIDRTGPFARLRLKYRSGYLTSLFNANHARPPAGIFVGAPVLANALSIGLRGKVNTL